MAVAFVFPGQGSQAVGMGRALAERSDVARKTLAEAGAILGDGFVEMLFEGPAEALQLTRNTQPAILAVSVAAHRALVERCDVTPVACAGHSLGELSALVAAAAMSFSDALRAVRARGEAMQAAVPVGEGTMAAVIGLAPERIAEVIGTVSTREAPVAVAGYNSLQQTTISGAAAAVERAGAALTEAGARRVLPLQVSAPFHSPLMKPVEEPLRAVLDGVTFAAPSVPVVSNVEAQPNRDPARITDLLIRQLTAPVRWVESVQAMVTMGAGGFVELGPGRAIGGMIKKIDRGLTTHAVFDGESLDRVVEALA